MKWVCLLLIVVGFSFDLIGSEARKYPVAEGSVISSTFEQEQYKAILKVKEGALHERQYFRSGDVRGIVSAVHRPSNRHGSRDTTFVDINSSYPGLTSSATFRTYSNLKFENISLVIELALIFVMFAILFRRNRWLAIFSWISIVISMIFWIYRNIILLQIHQFAGEYNAVTAILVILFALVFFYYQLSKPEHLFVYRSSAFWIVVGILLYKTGTFFLYLYANNLNLTDLLSFYLFDSIFYILQNILFAVSFLIVDKKSTLN